MSEIRLPAPLKATLVESISDPASLLGSFKYFAEDGRVSGMNFRCPCGCGHLSVLNFHPAIKPSWQWDGNRESPTLSPSVHRVGHWHGYLKAGFWTQA